ncbi:YbjQ family protein [Trichothermofontia sp.]
MLLTTTDIIQGAIVESYLGVVTAEVVYGTNAFRDFFAGIRDFVGGRTASYEQVFKRGQQEALEELSRRAERLGANAVIGIQMDTGTVSVDKSGSLLLITASGTAIRLQETEKGWSQ